MSQSKLNQDPHKLRETREKNLESAIGRELREIRHKRDMTVADLAQTQDDYRRYRLHNDTSWRFHNFSTSETTLNIIYMQPCL